jgi:hypothetical protein
LSALTAEARDRLSEFGIKVWFIHWMMSRNRTARRRAYLQELHAVVEKFDITIVGMHGGRS